MEEWPCAGDVDVEPGYVEPVICNFSNGKSTIHYFWNLCVFVFLLGGPSANLRLSSYQLTINPTVNLQ